MPFLATGYEVYQGEKSLPERKKTFPMASALNRLFKTLVIWTFLKYHLIENEIKNYYSGSYCIKVQISTQF